MKIAVLNFSGNVGKTTIAKNLLLPRLPDTPYLAIETINDDGANSEDIKVTGKDYGTVQNELAINDNLLIDIGSSNIEQTLKNIGKRQQSHNDYDYFILPTVASIKEQIDTNSTILELLDLGIPAEKIRMVFNKLDEPDEFAIKFKKVIQQAELLNIRVPTVGIQENEVYSYLRELGISMQDLLAMKDLREKVRQAESREKKLTLATLLGGQRLAMTAQQNLDKVFADLALEASEV